MNPEHLGWIFVVAVLGAVPLLALVVDRLFGRETVYRLRDSWSPQRRALALVGVVITGAGISLVANRLQGSELDRPFAVVPAVICLVGAGMVAFNLPRLRRSPAEARRQRYSAAAGMSCPECNATMTVERDGEIAVDRCPQCGGLWFDLGELGPTLVARAPASAGALVDDSALRDLSPIEGGDCPRCPPARLRIGSVRGLAYQRCLRCGGFFLSPHVVDSLSVNGPPASLAKDPRRDPRTDSGGVIDSVIQLVLEQRR